MALSSYAREAMLDAVFSGRLQLGLYKRDGSEETDPNYTRQDVALSGSNGCRENDGEIRFPPYANNSFVWGWFLVNMEGHELGREPLIVPKQMAPRERLLFLPGDIVVKQEG